MVKIHTICRNPNLYTRQSNQEIVKVHRSTKNELHQF